MPWWFIVLWLILIATALVSKSLLGYLALIFTSVLGQKFSLDLAYCDTIRYTLVGFFLLFALFAIYQIVTQVDRI
jgi:hypothetical protein